MGLLSDLLKLFSGKRYGTPSRTLQGEMVKSRAEQEIADYFTRNGIRYIYEHSAKTDALIFKRTFAHPDFYLPDYSVYVEYWGLLGTSKQYEKTMKWKMAQYHQNGIKFISIYPKNLGNLEWVFRTKFRDAVGINLPLGLPTRSSGARFCTSCGSRAVATGKFCTSCGKPLPVLG